MTHYYYETVINWDLAPAWIQSATAIFAAFFLIKTVRLQQTTLGVLNKQIHDQQKISSIQYETYLRDLRPDIRFGPGYPEASTDNLTRISVYIHILSNDAKNIAFELMESSLVIASLLDIENNLTFQSKSKIGFYAAWPSESPDMKFRTNRKIGKLYFEDSIETKYSMIAYLNPDNILNFESAIRIKTE